MERTDDYQIINDTAPAIETTLAIRTTEGWRPILMSTAAVNTAVQGLYRFRETDPISIHEINFRRVW